MNYYEEIKTRLQDHPWFRERKARNLGIAKMLIGKYKLEIDPKILEDVIAEASTLDRTWRKVLQECPHLQGKDYQDKVVLEQKKELELGYQPMYHEVNKQVKLKL